MQAGRRTRIAVPQMQRASLLYLQISVCSHNKLQRTLYLQLPVTDSPTQSDDDSALPTTNFTSILPFDTPAPRIRRQADASGDDISLCGPYTIIQGPQTYEMHLTDPSPGVWTMNVACNWKGEITTADLTCTLTQSGDLVASNEQGPETSVVLQSDVQSLYQTVALVGATGSSSGASQTPAASGSSSGTAAPTKSASGSEAAAKSTGLAPAGPLQTGAILGGVVGIFAAALAL
jgi:hypothetical protein